MMINFFIKNYIIIEDSINEELELIPHLLYCFFLFLLKSYKLLIKSSCLGKGFCFGVFYLIIYKIFSKFLVKNNFYFFFFFI